MPSLSQQQAAKHVGNKTKRPAKQGSGLNKQPVERKRQADDALDQLAARPARSSKGMYTVPYCLEAVLEECASCIVVVDILPYLLCVLMVCKLTVPV